MSILLEQAIIQQNPHWAGELYVQKLWRAHDERAKSDLTLQEIQIVTGIRRSGKSTLLHQLINQLSVSVDLKHVLYINFDDPNFHPAHQQPQFIQEIVTTAEKLSGKQIDYFLLDEIQTVISWEAYIKSAYDSQRFKKIILTGSNGQLLNSDYATLLSGRYLETRINPLSFSEVLKNHGIDSPAQLAKQHATVLRLLDGMLEFGGFPRILQLDQPDDKLRMLKSYYDTVLLKDCISNHAIRDVPSFSALANYAVNNVAALYSYNSLGKAVETNENTVQSFIQILQDAYFMRELKQFAFSAKPKTRNKKKLYCVDNGLVNAVTYKFSNNSGKLLENLTFTELHKSSVTQLCFHNQQKECDFIVQGSDGLLAIQVCYLLTEENRKREITGLQAAMQAFNIPTGIVLTYDQEETRDGGIHVLPFWKYFASLAN